MIHRRDIQALRGIAVLLVIGFHLELPGFSRGFLGVDIFFVISGYLMAMMYTPQQKLEFFMRRAGRLLPAYFATIVAVLLVATATTVPTDFGQVQTQAIYASLFSSNIGFWLENSYFDKSAFKPLLHLWSLGVEIQFYLLVPLLCSSFRRRWTYFALMIFSLVSCLLLVRISPKTAFFITPFRLWEFLVGFGIASYLQRATDRRSKTKGLVALLGLTLLPLLPVDGSRLDPVWGHPGLAAVGASLLTGALLLYGLPQRLEQASAFRALEKVGGMSYSIYLAHFPVIVLVLYSPFGGTVLRAQSVAQTLLIAALIALASFALYHLVEKPFRNSRVGLRRIALASIFVSVVGGTLAYAQDRNTPPAETLIFSAWEDRAPYRCGKLNRLLNPTAKSCEITQIKTSPQGGILLVGNSHADSIKMAFAQAAATQNVAVHFVVENNPLMEGGLGPAEILAEAKLQGATAVALHYSPRVLSGPLLQELATLARKQGILLALILPVPVWQDSVPEMLYRTYHGTQPLPTRKIEDYLAFNAQLLKAAPEIESSGIRIYGVAEVFCTPDCAMTDKQGRPLYFDSGHLTLTGATLLQPVFERAVTDLSPE